MVKKKEEARKEVLKVWASPSWTLKKEGQQIKLDSPAGFFGYEKEGMVEVEITVEEK